MCRQMIRAIGYRMAYDAAVESHLDPRLINLYVASVIKLDSGWYVQHTDWNLNSQRTFESDAVEAAYPLLDEWLSQTRAKDYVRDVPIVSQENWNAFVANLPKHETAPKAHL